jgi:hypothetical protein
MAGDTPHITKVLWIFMENVSYGTATNQIPGNPKAAYIDHTLLSQCGSTSNYHAISHPSYPNYLAATSGSTQGVSSDTLGLFSGPSIFAQVDPSWRSYEEFMPKVCDHVGQTGTSTTHQYYVGRHNPAASYSSLPVGAPTAGDCPTNDVALGTATSGALQHDVASGSLPAFSVVTPGLCDDMHVFPAGDSGCPTPVKAGDSWLAQWIPILTSGPDYTSGNLMIDVTWDEGAGGAMSANCVTSNTPDCIIPDIVISPYTTPVVAPGDYSHYSLLRTTESILGLPLLGHAADATTNDMCAPFGLCPAQGTAPTASFTASCSAQDCGFDGSGSTAPGSTISSYAWSFGDNSTGTGESADHSYALGGTYPVTLTVTNAEGLTGSVTQHIDVVGNGPGGISVVGSAGTTAKTATESVSVPGTVTAGDAMLLFGSAVATSPLTGPAGWTLVGTQPNPVMTTSVWSRVATAADPGQSVTVRLPAAAKGSLQLVAYAGTDPTAPVATVSSSTGHTPASSATTSTVNLSAAGDWVVSAWAAKSSAVTGWTAPSGTTVRNAVFGTGGGQISSLVVDGGGPAGPGMAGGVTARSDQQFGAWTTWTIALAPAG